MVSCFGLNGLNSLFPASSNLIWFHYVIQYYKKASTRFASTSSFIRIYACPVRPSIGCQATPLVSGGCGKSTSYHSAIGFVCGFCSGRPALIDYRAIAAYAHPLLRHVIIAYEGLLRWVQVLLISVTQIPLHTTVPAGLEAREFQSIRK